MVSGALTGETQCWRGSMARARAIGKLSPLLPGNWCWLLAGPSAWVASRRATCRRLTWGLFLGSGLHSMASSQDKCPSKGILPSTPAAESQVHLSFSLSGVLTQSSTLCRQALYHLSHAPSPSSSCFDEGGLRFHCKKCMCSRRCIFGKSHCLNTCSIGLFRLRKV
jgi:hypothetical protein